MQALLSHTYFGPIQWYQKLYRYKTVYIEQHDSYQKQTYRNRCVIATTNGLQALTIPVVRGEGIRISNHGNWRHLHWHALMSAYNESPFFEYYADDIRPFFEEDYEFLYDLDLAACRKVCELIDIEPDIRLTDDFVRPASDNEWHDTASASHGDGLHDFREAINPKHPAPDADFTPRRYYQVYEREHGFQANLSILDLLFNMGPESVFYL